MTRWSRSSTAKRRSRNVTVRRLTALLCVGTVLLVGPGFTPGFAAPGDTRAEPAPIGTEITAGPWSLTVAEVVTGDAATEQVLAANPINEPPRDGFSYVAIRVVAVNDGENPLVIGSDDFALTTASGLVRRFTGVVGPEPVLDGTAQPGDTLDGWIVLGAPADDTDRLLLYDSVTLTGSWADRIFALSDDATIADPDTALAEPNDVGLSTDDPAAVGEVIVTGSWEVELLGIASCQEVFDMSDFRVQALGPEDASNESPWLALNVRVTNVRPGGEPAFLSPTAFMLADPDGATVSDVITLSAPAPDASGAYYPGATREGWVAFELPAAYVDAGNTLIRFLPYRGETDERFLSFADSWSDCRR